MLFISPKTNDCIQEFAVSLNDTLISTEKSAKYLGVIIDTNLNFSDHIKAVELKIFRAVEILHKLKFVLPSKSLVTLYYSFIHSHLLYCLVVWESTFPTYLNRLAALQNKAIKVIGGCNYNDSATPLYLEFEVLKLVELYKLEVAKLIYDCIHNNIPYSLSNMFIQTSQISARTTRSSINTNNLNIPRYRTNKLQRSMGVKIWNSIPSDIQKLPKRHFIRKLKSHLLQTYN